MNEAANKYRREYIASFLNANEAALKSLGCDPDIWRSVDLTRLNLPSLDTRIALYRQNLQFNALTNRSLDRARSDMADVVHGAYLPYVDVFRADSFAADIFADEARRWDVSIVANLRELPNRIQALRNITTGALRPSTVRDTVADAESCVAAACQSCFAAQSYGDPIWHVYY